MMMRVLAILIVAFGLSACGFRPLHGNANTLAGSGSRFDMIEIADIKGIERNVSSNAMNIVNNTNTINAFTLRNALIDRFYHSGYPNNPRYILQISTQETRRDIVIERDDTKSRAQVVVLAFYKLLDKETRAIVDEGSIRSSSSYNILLSEYTTSVTREQAREMALRDVADKITMRMAVVLDNKYRE